MALPTQNLSEIPQGSVTKINHRIEITMTDLKLVLPGDILGSASKLSPGPGTHIHNGQVLASIAGFVQIKTTKDPDNKMRVIQTAMVALETNTQSTKFSDSQKKGLNITPRLPSVGAVVYAKITQVQRAQALSSILALQSPSSDAVTACEWPLRGILRSQDVRMTEKDRVKMNSSVAVGDIIRAEVVSLGDQGGYYLSTAGNELGVVMAWSQNGNVCVPVSWKEVVDEITGIKEERKVAKPL
jgi:exosome complex component CSL4